MTFTRAQLGTRLLKYPGIIGIDETPSAAEQEEAEEVVETGIATLNGLGINLWNSTDNSITHEYLIPLIEWLAPILLCANGQIDWNTKIQFQNVAEAKLRKLSQTGPTGAVLKVNYF